MMDVTGSSNFGHAMCCRSDFYGENCNNDDRFVCSQPSYVDVPDSSSISDQLTSGNLNYAMYAFCPSINQQVCGLSEDNTLFDLTIQATESPQTFSSNILTYRQGSPFLRAYHFCYYEIQTD